VAAADVGAAIEDDELESDGLGVVGETGAFSGVAGGTDDAIDAVTVPGPELPAVGVGAGPPLDCAVSEGGGIACPAVGGGADAGAGAGVKTGAGTDAAEPDPEAVADADDGGGGG
jgi:hypothetical protein